MDERGAKRKRWREGTGVGAEGRGIIKDREEVGDRAVSVDQFVGALKNASRETGHALKNVER